MTVGLAAARHHRGHHDDGDADYQHDDTENHAGPEADFLQPVVNGVPQPGQTRRAYVSTVVFPAHAPDDTGIFTTPVD